MLRHQRIYLDHAAKTPIDRRVLAYLRKLEKHFVANPSSLHKEGVAAATLLKEARERVARVLEVKVSEVYFTATGTEANNLALIGSFLAARAAGQPFHLITTVIEHSATREVARRITELGGSVTLVPVSADGTVDPKKILAALRPETRLVSVMYVNNEIGTIEPLRDISRLLVRENATRSADQHIFFHTDAAQAPLFLPIEAGRLGVDMMSFDGIKIGGPSNTACLIKKHNVPLQPIIVGGGQESGLRSGTESVAALAAFAYALELAQKEAAATTLRLTKLREFMFDELQKISTDIIVNGSRDKRVANNVNICLPGLQGEFLVLELDEAGIAAATSSACRTLSENGESYVVEATTSRECAASSLRFSFGKQTTQSDIRRTIKVLTKIIKK